MVLFVFYFLVLKTPKLGVSTISDFNAGQSRVRPYKRIMGFIFFLLILSNQMKPTEEGGPHLTLVPPPAKEGVRGWFVSFLISSCLRRPNWASLQFGFFNVGRPHRVRPYIF